MTPDSSINILHRFGMRVTMFGPTTFRLVRNLAAYTVALERQNAKLNADLQKLMGDTKVLLKGLDLLKEQPK